MHLFTRIKTKFLSASQPCPPHQLHKIENVQEILIWPLSDKNPRNYLALFDTGAQINLIIRSIVNDLDLPIYKDYTGPEVVEVVEGMNFLVNNYVQPKWQLHIGQTSHREFPFFVVDQLPHSLGVVLGYHVMNDIGISLHASKMALPLFLKSGKDSNVQKQPQHTSQILDGARRREQRQKTLDQAHGYTAKPSEHRTPQHQPSQQLAKERDSAYSQSQNKTSHK
ncbi:MAG: hypothetical protein Q9191_003331 [Dirinaria sp. TL-2023a]